MVDEKGLPPAVADRIGQFVVLRGRPRELLAKLLDAGEPAVLCCAALSPVCQEPGLLRRLPELALWIGTACSPTGIAARSATLQQANRLPRCFPQGVAPWADCSACREV